MTGIVPEPDGDFTFSAKWITLPRFSAPRNLYFRAVKRFDLNDVPEKALLRICADTNYLLYINGKRIQYGPVRGTCTLNYYDTLDVALFLRKGANVIGVLIHSPVTETFISVSAVPALILEIPGLVRTGGDWKVQEAPDWKQEVSFYTPQTDYMEHRDLALEPPGWLNGQSVENWGNAREVPAESPLLRRRLKPRNVPALREFERRPVSVEQIREVMPSPEKQEKISLQLNNDILEIPREERLRGLDSLLSPDGTRAVIEPASDGSGFSFILDFGDELLGRFLTEIDAPAGAILDVTYGEEIWQEKKDRLRASFSANSDYNFSDRYLLKEGLNEVGSSVTERGFRMVQLTFRNFSAPIRILECKAVAHEYPYQYLADFNSGDPLLNRIWEVCVHTLQVCSTDTFMDCPWRERAFWVNDLVVENSTSLAAFGASSIHRRAFELLFSQQLENGYLPGVCPAPAAHPCVLLPTNFFVFITLRDYYMATGDLDTVRGYMEPLARILKKMESLADEKGVLGAQSDSWNFYDWGFEECGYDFREKRESMLNYLYLTALKIFMDFADLCGIPSDRAGREKKIAELSGKLAEEFIPPESGYLADPVRFRPGGPSWEDAENVIVQTTVSSQVAHAFALLSGEVGNKNKEKFRKALTDDVLHRPEYYLHFFIFRAMEELDSKTMRNGLERIRHHWRRCIETGSTTMYESGVHDFGRHAFGGAGSLCHGFSTAPIAFFQRIILGVRPLEAGFRRFSVTPHLFDLAFAEGRVPTPRGNIGIHCRKENDRRVLSVTVPHGLTAVIEGKDCPEGSHTLVLSVAE